MQPIRYFDSVQLLEPHCGKCQQKIDFGITTVWDDALQSQKCKGCGTKVGQTDVVVPHEQRSSQLHIKAA